MAVTRLKRKARRNKLTAKLRNQKIALESAKPVIKNVDIEAIKAEFKANAAKQIPPKAEVKETKKATVADSTKDLKNIKKKKAVTKAKTPSSSTKSLSKKKKVEKKVTSKKKEDPKK